MQLEQVVTFNVGVSQSAVGPQDGEHLGDLAQSVGKLVPLAEHERLRQSVAKLSAQRVELTPVLGVQLQTLVQLRLDDGPRRQLPADVVHLSFRHERLARRHYLVARLQQTRAPPRSLYI